MAATRGVRTLTQRQPLLAVLDRQLLLARSKLPIPKVLERMGSLPAQYAPSMYIGLWTRSGTPSPPTSSTAERGAVSARGRLAQP